MQRGVRAAASNLVYGVADGQALTDMKPFLGPATHLLQTVCPCAVGAIQPHAPFDSSLFAAGNQPPSRCALVLGGRQRFFNVA